MSQHFSDKIEKKIQAKNSCLLLSLDPDIKKLPQHIPENLKGIEQFCIQMIEKMAPLIMGIKIQMACFEIFGSEGIKLLEKLLQIIRGKDLCVILDGKRGDINNTAQKYAQAYLDENSILHGDSLTVNPFMGKDAIEPYFPYLKKQGRSIFILLRTSNPSAIDFQGGEKEISLAIAEKVDEWNIGLQSEKNFYSSIGVVVGATVPSKLLKFFREELPHSWFLCPGVGVQGGDFQNILAIRDKNKNGVLIPLGREILYASNKKDFLDAGYKKLFSYYEQQK